MRLTPEQSKMVEENHGLIYWYAHKYKLDLDEWYDILAIALCKAVLKYDDTKSNISTYASMTMKNEVLREFRKRRAEKRCKYFEVSADELVGVIDDRDGNLEDMLVLKDILENDPRGEIIKLYAHGYTQSEIAMEIGISQAHVSRIIKSVKEEVSGD